jgi:hypothetical protein
LLESSSMIFASNIRITLSLSRRLTQLLLLTAVTASYVQAEDSPEAGSLEASPSPTSAPSPTPRKVHSKVEPLDPWKMPDPDEKKPDKKPSPQPSGAVAPAGLPSLPSPTSTPVVPLVTREVPLLKDQKKRMDELLKSIRIRAGRRLAEQKAKTFADSRGGVEVRLCSLNLRNYGLQPEVKRLLKAKGTVGYKKRERAAINSISAQQCGIVAIQGVIGKNVETVSEALIQFTQRLSKKSGKEWKFAISSRSRELGVSGVLYVPQVAQFSGSKSYLDLELPRLGKYDEKNFARVPMEAAFRIKRNGSDEINDLLIFVVHFQKALTSTKPEPEFYRVQMAEAVRTLVARRIAEEREKNPGKAPMIVVAGDIGSSLGRPAAMVLSGRLTLEDFSEGSGCKIVEEKLEPSPSPGDATAEETPPARPSKPEEEKIIIRYHCDHKLQRPVTLFNVLVRQIPELLAPGKKLVEEEKPFGLHRRRRRLGRQRQRFSSAKLLRRKPCRCRRAACGRSR